VQTKAIRIEKLGWITNIGRSMMMTSILTEEIPPSPLLIPTASDNFVVEYPDYSRSPPPLPLNNENPIVFSVLLYELKRFAFSIIDKLFQPLSPRGREDQFKNSNQRLKTRRSKTNLMRHNSNRA